MITRSQLKGIREHGESPPCQPFFISLIEAKKKKEQKNVLCGIWQLQIQVLVILVKRLPTTHKYKSAPTIRMRGKVIGNKIFEIRVSADFLTGSLDRYEPLTWGLVGLLSPFKISKAHVRDAFP